MSNFELNQSVPPPKEEPTKSVIYTTNENPFGLPFSTRSLLSLVVGVVFLGIVAAVATFIIVTSRQNNTENVPLVTNAITPFPTPTIEVPTPTLALESLSPTPVSVITTPTPTIIQQPPSSNTSYTSNRYGYSLTNPTGWTRKNFGAVDSKTAEMVGFDPQTITTSEDAAILVAVKNRTYQEEVDTVPGTKEPVTVAEVSGTKITWQSGKGITFIKVVIPLNTNALAFVAKSQYSTELNQILASYTQNTLGATTSNDGGNPYIDEE